MLNEKIRIGIIAMIVVIAIYEMVM